MTTTHITLNKTALATALAVSLGAASNLAHATTYDFAIEGAFTMLNPTGSLTPNSAKAAYVPPWYGQRTAINGLMHYDTNAGGTGSMTISPFLFFGDLPANNATATNLTFKAIGNGNGGTGTLLLANMGFDWNGTVGIPVSIVWDGAGMLNALSSLTCGVANPNLVVTGVGALPATNGLTAKGINMILGASPIAATTWNTTTLSGAVLGSNPSGDLPLIADTIGGSPMVAGPFPGFNANFDFTKLTLNKLNNVDCSDIVIASRAPAENAINVPATSPVAITFSEPVTNGNVITANTFKVVRTADSSPVTGNISVNGTVVTLTPTPSLDFLTQYTVNFTAPVIGGNGHTIATVPSWSFTTRAKSKFETCDASGPAPTGSNFTMLNASGINAGGGANDVVFAWDGVESADITANNFTHVSISSKTKYSGFNWTAHHIRIFGPGDYILNTDCTTAQLEAGTCTPNTDDSKNYHVHVPVNYYATHMLFDWSTNSNIDVVNLWKRNGVWPDYTPEPKGMNDLYTGDWAGAPGLMVNINPPTDIAEGAIPGATPAIWDYVSTDVDGDGIIGLKMIDGPFIGFNANFNIHANSSCVAVQPPPTTVANTQLGGGGCTLSASPVSPLKRGDGWLLAGFIVWMGVLAAKRKRA